MLKLPVLLLSMQSDMAKVIANLAACVVAQAFPLIIGLEACPTVPMDPHSRGEFLRAFPAVKQEQDGHSDCQTIGHLLENEGAVAVGDLAVDLHSAIDWTGMHDQAIGFQQFGPIFS